MEKIELNEILLLNETSNNDFQKCYNYLKTYIENIKENEFHHKFVIDLKALIDKFLEFADSINISGLVSDLNDYANKLELSCYKKSFDDDVDSEVETNIYYQHLYSNFLKVYNKINSHFRNSKEELLEFDGLINYDISNKRKAILTIQDAIDLITSDITLSEKSKKKILNHLAETIQELINPKTNWTKFFVKTAEIVVILGSLGSLAGGIEAGSNLLKAKEIIETAKEEIVSTSINLNYMNVENTFNISKPIEIENNKILLLGQSNEQ